MTTLLFVLAVLLPGFQAGPAQTPAVQTPVAPLTPTPGDQLGAGDTLHVTVWTGNEYIIQDLAIAPDGTILIPFFVNKLVQVAGMTSTEVRSLLLDELRKNYRE